MGKQLVKVEKEASPKVREEILRSIHGKTKNKYPVFKDYFKAGKNGVKLLQKNVQSYDNEIDAISSFTRALEQQRKQLRNLLSNPKPSSNPNNMSPNGSQHSVEERVAQISAPDEQRNELITLQNQIENRLSILTNQREGLKVSIESAQIIIHETGLRGGIEDIKSKRSALSGLRSSIKAPKKQKKRQKNKQNKRRANLNSTIRVQIENQKRYNQSLQDYPDFRVLLESPDHLKKIAMELSKYDRFIQHWDTKESYSKTLDQTEEEIGQLQSKLGDINRKLLLLPQEQTITNVPQNKRERTLTTDEKIETIIAEGGKRILDEAQVSSRSDTNDVEQTPSNTSPNPIQMPQNENNNEPFQIHKLIDGLSIPLPQNEEAWKTLQSVEGLLVNYARRISALLVVWYDESRHGEENQLSKPRGKTLFVPMTSAGDIPGRRSSVFSTQMESIGLPKPPSAKELKKSLWKAAGYIGKQEVVKPSFPYPPEGEQLKHFSHIRKLLKDVHSKAKTLLGDEAPAPSKKDEESDTPINAEENGIKNELSKDEREELKENVEKAERIHFVLKQNLEELYKLTPDLEESQRKLGLEEISLREKHQKNENINRDYYNALRLQLEPIENECNDLREKIFKGLEALLETSRHLSENFQGHYELHLSSEVLNLINNMASANSWKQLNIPIKKIEVSNPSKEPFFDPTAAPEDFESGANAITPTKESKGESNTTISTPTDENGNIDAIFSRFKNEVIATIKDNEVDKAKRESEKIIANAHEEAKSIIEEARNKARCIAEEQDKKTKELEAREQELQPLKEFLKSVKSNPTLSALFNVDAKKTS